MSARFNYGRGNYGRFGDQSLVSHMCNFIGDTVTIFTTSGGPSGCGFTGILMAVNCEYVRVSTNIGRGPANPLSETICPRFAGGRDDYDACGCYGGCEGADVRGGFDGCDGFDGRGAYDDCDGLGGRGGRGGRKDRGDDICTVGSVCDIPVDRIAAFCHNAV